MICPNCGIQNRRNVRFCPGCGAAMPSTEPLSSDSSGASVDSLPRDTGPRASRDMSADDLVGYTLDNKYRIVEKIGSGGMGSIYKATRMHIGDTVAVKVLHPDSVGDKKAIERFRREAQAAARLKHNNAVGIYDFAVSPNNLVYIVMELVEGKNLARIIKEQGPLQPSFAVEIISRVCSALDEAHRQNIVHRDLKPDNILVNATSNDLTVKVLDFGIAKLCDLSAEVSTLTQKGMLVGTPQYMSPEQCMGEEIDGRADIYSLGIVLYEMLTGMLPFNSPTPTAIIVQHVTQPPPPLRQINSDVPPRLEQAVMHALEKRKEDRPQLASEFARELIASVRGPVPVRSARKAASRVEPEPQAPPATPLSTMEDAQRERAAFFSPEPAALHEKSGITKPAAKKFLVAATIIGILLLVLLVVAGLIIFRDSGTESTPNAQVGPPQAPAQPPAASRTPAPASQPKAPDRMVYVGGGEFLMGRDTGEQSERPQHRVSVKPFFIDVYEVTCEEYKRFIDATGHQAPPRWVNGTYPAGWARRAVTGISWDDANSYASWATKRLPTEQEWEFAARGTDGRLYPWGNQWKTKAGNAHNTSHGHVDAVGVHPAGRSPFGAYDMVGNVWEWTSSDMVAYPGGSLPETLEGEVKVVRGGSWQEAQDRATTTHRKGLPPRDGEYTNVGFRCAKDVTAAP